MDGAQLGAATSSGLYSQDWFAVSASWRFFVLVLKLYGQVGEANAN